MLNQKNIILLLILLAIFTLAGIFSFTYFRFTSPDSTQAYQMDNGTYYFLNPPKLSYPSGSSSDKKAAIKQFVDNEFKNLRNFAYLSVENQEIFINDINGEYKAVMKDDSWIRFHGAWFQLSNTFSGSPILISEDRIVTLPLSQGDENLSYIQHIRKKIEDQQTYFAKHIQEFKDKIKKWELISTQSGIPVTLTDTTAIIIPFQDSYDLEDITHQNEIYYFEDLKYKPNEDDMKVYRLIHRLEKSDISSYITAQIAVINHPTQKVDLKNYLPKARYVYQEDNGAIFHSEDGRYQALYHLYDAENDQYIIALYRALRSDVDDITKMYSIFRTMGSDIPKNIFNKDDFYLSPEQFEEKHHLTLEDHFTEKDFINELRIQFDRIINFATRYTTHSTQSNTDTFYPLHPKFTRFEYCYLSQQTNIIHYQPLTDLLQHFQSEDPNGLVYNEVFRWSTPTLEKAYSILIPDGAITYEVRNGSCKTDSIAQEKGFVYTLFLNMMLKKGHPFALDKLKTMTNAGKYPPYQSFFKAELPIYPVKEGIINLKGELIFPIDVRSHQYIDQKYLIINDHYLLNAQGERLLENIYIDRYLKKDLFRVKQDDQYKTYNAKEKTWIESSH